MHQHSLYWRLCSRTWDLANERRWKIYVSAACLGLSLNIRIQSLFFAPLLLVMCFFPVKGLRSALANSLHCSLRRICVGGQPGATAKHDSVSFTPENRLQFLDPILTPSKKATPSVFSSLCSIKRGAVVERIQLTAHWLFHCKHFWYGDIFCACLFLLTCVGLLFVRKSAFALCALLSVLSFLASTLAFVFSDLRFYLPVFVLSIAVAVLPMNWAANNLLVGRRAIAVIPILILFTASCLGYPSRSGYNTPEIDRSQAWDALHFFTERQAPRWLNCATPLS